MFHVLRNFHIFAYKLIAKEIIFEDKDLEELIFTGQNNKYKKFAKDSRFMQSLGRVYKSMIASADCDALRQFSYLHYEKLKQ